MNKKQCHYCKNTDLKRLQKPFDIENPEFAKFFVIGHEFVDLHWCYCCGAYLMFPKEVKKQFAKERIIDYAVLSNYARKANERRD